MAQPKKTGLGKGLDALFGGVSINEQPQETVVEEKSEINDNLKSLKITEVEPNRDQPRKQFKQEALEDLAESIKTYGIIQPIVVTKQDGYYGIVAGERRWRAAKLAGLEEIPAIIREDDEQKNREIALIENIQREDLNPYEKALGIRNLMDKYGLTQEEVSKRIGKSRSAVSNTVRILNLAPDVLELVKEGKLSEGHCKALAADEQGESLLDKTYVSDFKSDSAVLINQNPESFVNALAKHRNWDRMDNTKNIPV